MPVHRVVAFGNRAANRAGVSGPNNVRIRIGIIEAYSIAKVIAQSKKSHGSRCDKVGINGVLTPPDGVGSPRPANTPRHSYGDTLSSRNRMDPVTAGRTIFETARYDNR